jgi:hypothetical protein
MKMRGVRTHRGGALTGTEVRGIDRMRKPTPSRGFRRGIAIVWTAIILVLMLGFVGLSLDWGKAAIDAHQLQNAADAAALAGAQKLKKAYHDSTMDAPDGPFGRAKAVALANRAWAGTPVDLYYASPTAYDPTVDVVIGRFFPGDKHWEPFNPAAPESPNALKAVTRHVAGWPANAPLPLTFGPVFGQDRANVARVAIAINVGGGGAALVCLAPDGVGLKMEGGAKLRVNEGSVDGEVYVDSDWEGAPKYAVYPNVSAAPDYDKGWYIDCAGLNTCGRVDPTIMDYFGRAPNYIYPVVEHASYMKDPLAWLLPPTDAGPIDYGMAVQVDDTGLPVKNPATGDYVPLALSVATGDPITSQTIRDFGTNVGGRMTLTLAPGYYPGGISLTSSGSDFKTIKMLPGVYAVGGGNSNGDNSGLVLTGGALDAEGVMFYVTQSDQGAREWGHVNISGNYEYIKLTEYEYLDGDPDYYKNYDYKNYDKSGMCIFQDRANSQDAVIVGGADNMVMSGTLYFHNQSVQEGVPTNGSEVTVEVGGSCGQNGIQLITDRVLLHGDADIRINYDGRNFQPADQSLLVK